MARFPAERRRQSIWRRLDAASRWVFPAAMLAFGLFLLGLPLHIPGQALLRPAYAMGCVYFWSLYRPASLPVALTALAGLLLDLMGVSPPGLWALLLILLQWTTMFSRRRLAAQRFRAVWGGFTVLAGLTAILAWALESVLDLSALPFWPTAVEILFAAALYPALAAVLIRAHRSAAAVEQA